MDKIMQHFFDQALGRISIPTEASAGHKVYEELVHHRFVEVITKAFPLLTQHVPQEQLEEAITLFVKNAPKTPYIWQVPFFFWKFIHQKALLDLPFVDDLLWYEWSEIELMMDVFEPLHVSLFSWKSTWEKHPSVRVRKLEYRVFESNFDEHGEWYLIAWYDAQAQCACYKEINEALFFFLESLERSSWEESVQSLMEATQSDRQSIENYLNEAMIALAQEDILQKKELK